MVAVILTRVIMSFIMNCITMVNQQFIINKYIIICSLMYWKETGGVEKLFALPSRDYCANPLFAVSNSISICITNIV